MRRNYSRIRWAVALVIIASGWGTTLWLKLPLPIDGLFGMSRGSVGDAAVARLPKLRIRSSNRHLIEDEKGTAFFVAGVCS